MYVNIRCTKVNNYMWLHTKSKGGISTNTSPMSSDAAPGNASLQAQLRLQKFNGLTTEH